MARLSRSRGSRDGSLTRFHRNSTIRSGIYITALTENAATAPKVATMTPPIAGPKLRAMLKLMPLSATAAGKLSGGTCSLTEDCQAGPISAMPVPTTKQNASRMFGVIRPSHATTVSEEAPTSEIDRATMVTTRRSCMSAMAPAGIEISMIGIISAVCTSATLSAEDAICVIAQAAPTPWINRPRLESRLASQMRRKTENFSGALRRGGGGVGGGFCFIPGLVWLAGVGVVGVGRQVLPAGGGFCPVLVGVFRFLGVFLIGKKEGENKRGAFRGARWGGRGNPR